MLFLSLNKLMDAAGLPGWLNGPIVAQDSKSYLTRILIGSNISHRGCAYTVLKNVHRP